MTESRKQFLKVRPTKMNVPEAGKLMILRNMIIDHKFKHRRSIRKRDKKTTQTDPNNQKKSIVAV